VAAKKKKSVKKKTVKKAKPVVKKRAAKKKKTKKKNATAASVQKKIAKAKSKSKEKDHPLKGNKFWLARTKVGREKIFENTEILWSVACEYFDWVDNNPLLEEKLFSYRGGVTRETVHKIRAMTIESLCLYLGIGKSTWSDYKQRDDFSAIVVQIENVIRSQKFAGAAADLLNANIIARDLGLKDKTDVTSNDEPIKNEWHIHPVTTIDK